MGMFAHLQILPGTGNRGPHSKERYFLEIRNRHKFLLEMGGERVLLLKRKYAGDRCSKFDQVRKTNQQHGQDTECYGTGFVGGYFKPIEIFVSLIAISEVQITTEEYGRRRTYAPTSWTLWEPSLNTGDVLIRKNGQRLQVDTVTPTRWKSFVLHQKFTTIELEKNHPIFSMPF